MNNKCVAGLAAVVFVAICGCGGPTTTKAKDEPAPVAPKQEQPATVPGVAPGPVVLGADAPELKQMTIEPVKTLPLPADEVSAPARIEANPNRVGHAVLPAPGRIVRLMVKLGDSVTQGQPLFTMDSPVVAEAESNFITAEASVRQAELALTKAEADLGRITDLYEHQAVAQKEVLSAQTTAALTKASLDQARSGRDQSRRRLQLLGLKPGQMQQQLTVTSPIGGKVTEISGVESEFRNEINVPLITITDLSRVWATSEVPESKIRFCRVGGTVDLELIAFPNEKFRARVTRIADTVNSETRSIKVSAELENPNGKLRPEMFGRLKYADGVVPTIWIPDSAVVRINGKDFVFLEQSKGRFQPTAIELGKPYEGGFAVLQGLKSGDRAVTQGSIYLKAAL
jgi:cobalt-zinc-cadmium efflux system membrane fusion protein